MTKMPPTWSRPQEMALSIFLTHTHTQRHAAEEKQPAAIGRRPARETISTRLWAIGNRVGANPFGSTSTLLVEMTCSAPPLSKSAIGCAKEASEVQVHASRQMGLKVTGDQLGDRRWGAGAEWFIDSLGAALVIN